LGDSRAAVNTEPCRACDGIEVNLGLRKKFDEAFTSYWGDGTQAIDYTAISDVALYTAAAPHLKAAGRPS
jgi:hypothetical protein